jgi:hypothetical protein
LPQAGFRAPRILPLFWLGNEKARVGFPARAFKALKSASLILAAMRYPIAENSD